MTPSQPAGSVEAFRHWCWEFKVKQALSESHPLLRTQPAKERIINATLPPGDDRDPGYARCRGIAQDVFEFVAEDGQGVHDKYRICSNFTRLYDYWARFHRIVEHPNVTEIDMRRLLDNLLHLVMETDGNLDFQCELPMVLPSMREELREWLELAVESTGRADAAVMVFAECKFAETASEQDIGDSLWNTSLHAFNPIGSLQLDPDHIAVPVLLVEYKVGGADIVNREAVLDCLIALLHREYIGLGDCPVYAFAISSETVYFYEAKVIDGTRTVTRHRTKLLLDTFQSWIAFYQMLCDLREVFQRPVRSVDFDAATERVEWRTAGGPWRPGKRARSLSSTSDSSLHKRARLDEALDSDSIPAYESGSDDDYSPREDQAITPEMPLPAPTALRPAEVQKIQGMAASALNQNALGLFTSSPQT